MCRVVVLVWWCAGTGATPCPVGQVQVPGAKKCVWYRGTGAMPCPVGQVQVPGAKKYVWYGAVEEVKVKGKEEEEEVEVEVEVEARSRSSTFHLPPSTLHPPPSTLHRVLCCWVQVQVPVFCVFYLPLQFIYPLFQIQVLYGEGNGCPSALNFSSTLTVLVPILP